MDGDDCILGEQFRHIEMKYAGLGAEAGAGDRAKTQIIARQKELASTADLEFRVPAKSEWEAAIFHALLTRYGLKAYRYRNQRKSTILVRVSQRFMDEYLWPIFTDVCRELFARFNLLTKALLPAIAPGPYHVAVLDHQHTGELCENCRQRLVEQS